MSFKEITISHLGVGLPCLHVLTVSFRVFAINAYKIGLPFTRTLTHDQRHGLLIAFPKLDHQSVCLFSQIRLHLIKYFTAAMLNGHYLTIGSIFRIL